MTLHAPAAERIKGGNFGGEGVARMLADMAKEANGEDSWHLVISFIEEDDEFVPGTYVPELHFILRKVVE